MSLNHCYRVSRMPVSFDGFMIITMHNYLSNIALLAVQWGYLNSINDEERRWGVIIKYCLESVGTCQLAVQDR